MKQIVALCVMLASCSVLQRAGWTGGGAAGGALAGSTMGPGGAAVGAGVGAVAASTLSENDELRDGDLVGSGALDDQISRWRGEAYTQQARATSLSKYLWWLVIAGALYVVWRNRVHLLAFACGGGFNYLWHAIVGGKNPEPKA